MMKSKSKIRLKQYKNENDLKIKMELKNLFKMYKIEKTSKLISSFFKKYLLMKIKEHDKKNLRILLISVILKEKNSKSRFI